MDEMLKALVTAASKEPSRALAMFNRTSGAAIGLLGWVDPITLNNEHYAYVEVEAVLSTDNIRGTIESFEIYNPSEEEVQEVHETALNTQAQEKILKVYPVGEQLNIMRNLLLEMVSVLGVKEDDLVALGPFREMNGYIEEVVANNNARKEYFASSPDYVYISDEDAASKFETTLDGGLHEIYGARRSQLLPGI